MSAKLIESQNFKPRKYEWGELIIMAANELYSKSHHFAGDVQNRPQLWRLIANDAMYGPFYYKHVSQ